MWVMGRRGPQNCPWTSSKKRKKRRKTETITMTEEKKSRLADSDNGSYYQHYFSTSSDSDGENIGCFLEVFLFSFCPPCFFLAYRRKKCRRICCKSRRSQSITINSNRYQSKIDIDFRYHSIGIDKEKKLWVRLISISDWKSIRIGLSIVIDYHRFLSETIFVNFYKLKIDTMYFLWFY